MNPKISILAGLLFVGSAPLWAVAPTQCHDADMYGIYKVCDAPAEQGHIHEHRQDQNRPEIVYMTQPTIGTPGNDTASVNKKLHALHLLLDDKKFNNEISADFYDEEARYLAQIEKNEQAVTASTGGYLTAAQEISFLQQLQDIETEINQRASNNG